MKEQQLDELLEHVRQAERMRLQLIEKPAEQSGEFTHSKHVLFEKLMDAYCIFDSHWWGHGATEDMVTQALKEVASALGQRSDDPGPTEAPIRPYGGDTGTRPEVSAALAGLDAQAAEAAKALAEWTGPVKPGDVK